MHLKLHLIITRAQQFNPEEFYKLLTVAEGRVVRDRECTSANVPKYIVEKLGLRSKDPVESTLLYSFILSSSCLDCSLPRCALAQCAALQII